MSTTKSESQNSCSENPIVCTRGMLDSPLNDEFVKTLKICETEMNTRFAKIVAHVETVREDFAKLQKLAENVSERYRNKASNYSGKMDRKGILQAILDHKLKSDDVRLFCMLIEQAFEYLVTRINNAVKVIPPLKSIVAIHHARAVNKQDFAYTLKDTEWMQKTKDFFGPLGQTVSHSEKRRQNLEEPDILVYAKTRIIDGVDDTELASALGACIRIVNAKFGIQNNNIRYWYCVF
uniref:uncharacterized protein LOC120343822 isoform X2 n=1 Tax=Styela clava TaxID=7725 RepID=UPI0019392B8D|nr:uncharacterized protein LOC120343822 isoform X2 [Styela clava]